MTPTQPAATATIAPEGAPNRYVWEVEGDLAANGTAEINIGGLQIALDLEFVHERRYALGHLFGFRNPQADIDRLILQSNVRYGDVVLDAGANIGVTAAEALACGAHHVVCAEPERGLVQRLHALRALCPDRMTIRDCALGAAEGSAELCLSVAHNQGHTVSAAVLAQFPSIFGDQRQKVTVSTIDHILSNTPADIWKLDIEGSEADAIRGATLTLKSSPPRLIIAELYDGIVEEAVALLPIYRVRRAALAKANYELRFLDQIGGALGDEFCSTSPIYVFDK